MQKSFPNMEIDDPATETGKAVGLSEILAPGLSVVFCGLNPALSALADGHNFSNRSNRFWRVLHLAGFTPRLLRPEEEREILNYGCGLTSAVSRATRGAGELTRRDYLDEVPALRAKMARFSPVNLAFLGKPAYMAISLRKHVEWGRQEEDFAGAAVWVLPNPSGLNRAFNLEKLAEHYRELKSALDTAG